MLSSTVYHRVFGAIESAIVRVEEGKKMDKQMLPPTSLWIVLLSACLCFLAGCNSQTPSLPATPPSIALTQTSSAFAQSTPDVIFKLVGTYTGSYQWHGSSSPAQLRLEITGQDVFVLTGICSLGNQSYPLLQAYVETAFGGEEGGITFTLDVPASQGQQPVSLNFSGTVTKEGVMAGNISAGDGRTGTWSAKKV